MSNKPLYLFLLLILCVLAVLIYVGTTPEKSSAIGGLYVYYVDPNATNQAANTTRGSRTVKDFIDNVGTVKNAILKFAHTASGNTTAYRFASSQTIPSNFELYIEDGAMLSPDSGVTITVSSPYHIKAGKRQKIITGNRGLAFTNAGTAYPHWWGVIGDGSTEDTGAVEAAFNSDAGRFYFPAGTYVIESGDIAIAGKDISIHGEGIGKTILDFNQKTGTGTYDITLSGATVTAISDLTGSFVKDATTINFAAAHTLSVGDIFILHTNSDYSFSDLADYFHQGEYCVVESVTDEDTVVTIRPLYAAYDSGVSDINVYKFNPAVVELRNLSIIPKANQHGFRIVMAQNVRVQDVEFNGTSGNFLYLDMVYEGFIDRLSIYATGAYSNSYGVYLGSVQHGVISNSTINTWQNSHAVTTGSVGPIYIPCRDITIDGIKSCGSIKLHGNIEYSTIMNCDVDEGIFMGGDYGSMLNCRTGGDSGVINAKGYNFNIIGNQFIATQTLTSTTHIFRSGDIAANQIERDSTFIFADNIVNPGAYGKAYSFGALLSQENDIHHIITGNTFVAGDINISGTGGTLKTLTFSDNICIGAGSFNLGGGLLVGQAIINDNVFNDYYVNCPFSASGDADYLEFSGNSSLGADYAPYFEYVDVLSVRNNTILNNDDGSGSGTDYQKSNMNIKNCTYVILEGNTFGDIRNEQVQTRVAGVNTITWLFEKDNTQVGNELARISGGIINHYIGRDYYGSYRETVWPTIPTAGTWKQGDIVWETDVAAGARPGWACTTSGTMGTLNGGATTGDTLNGQAFLTDLNALTDLLLGQYVDIVGVADLGYIKKTIAAVAATTVDASSASGQKVLNVTATTDFAVGESIVIDRSSAEAGMEIGVIASIQAGVSLTLEDNLTSTHTAGAVENIVVTSVAADATVDDAAVSWDAAVFKELADIDA